VDGGGASFRSAFLPEIPYFLYKSRNFPAGARWLAWHLQADRPTTSTVIRSSKSSERDECLLRLFGRAFITSAPGKIC
jgi:hypothetical protein